MMIGIDEGRPLGGSSLRVSPLALGSWRTFERLGFDGALAVFRDALACGINFFDDARYDDETGHAELVTGFSEVLFGRLVAACGCPRDELVVANKLWWEHWPAESARAELSGSLQRMGLDRVELIYAVTRPPELSVERAVHEIGELLSDGLATSWGVANWDAGDLVQAADLARSAGLPGPVAAQLSYSLTDRAGVESDALERALKISGASLIPSWVLAGGLLSAKYGRRAEGRMATELEQERWQPALRAGAALAQLATELKATPAQLALAFALDHPRTASVLFGATSVDQVRENAGALAVHRRLTPEQRERLREIGA